MPCRLSRTSRSVLANPLEHQCSCATVSPGCGSNSLAHVRHAVIGFCNAFEPIPYLSAFGNEIVVGVDHHQACAVFVVVHAIHFTTASLCAVLHMWKWVHDANVHEIQFDEVVGRWWSCCGRVCRYPRDGSGSLHRRSSDDQRDAYPRRLQARSRRRRLRCQRQLRIRRSVQWPRWRSGRTRLCPRCGLRLGRPECGSGRHTRWQRMPSRRRLRLRPRLSRIRSRAF